MIKEPRSSKPLEIGGFEIRVVELFSNGEELRSASNLSASNSTRLKFALFRISHKPKDLMVSFNLIQFWIGYLVTATC